MRGPPLCRLAGLSALGCLAQLGRWLQRTEDWHAIANLPFVYALIGQARPRNSTSAQSQGIRGRREFTMVRDATCIAIDEARAETQLSSTDQLVEEIDDRAHGGGGAKLGGFIAVIESRTFIRECIGRSVQSAFAQPVLTYSTAVELEQQHLFTSAQLIIFSWVEDNNTEASTNALKVLSNARAEDTGNCPRLQQ